MKILLVICLILMCCSSKESLGEFNEDGSHKKLTLWLKDKMNDPDSYEHVSTIVDKRSTYRMLIVEFRGKNAFGAKVKNKIYARIAPDGEVLETAESDVWLSREIHGGDVRSEEEKYLETIDSARFNAKREKPTP
jgi:hypothetical protein